MHEISDRLSELADICLNPLVTIDAYKRHTDIWWFMCVTKPEISQK